MEGGVPDLFTHNNHIPGTDGLPRKCCTGEGVIATADPDIGTHPDANHDFAYPYPDGNGYREPDNGCPDHRCTYVGGPNLLHSHADPFTTPCG
jgi:hypothetical protein